MCISAGPCLSGATRLRSHVASICVSRYQVNLYSYQVICTSVVSGSAVIKSSVLV